MPHTLFVVGKKENINPERRKKMDSPREGWEDGRTPRSDVGAAFLLLFDFSRPGRLGPLLFGFAVSRTTA